jgi:hypothetical protein
MGIATLLIPGHLLQGYSKGSRFQGCLPRVLTSGYYSPRGYSRVLTSGYHSPRGYSRVLTSGYYSPRGYLPRVLTQGFQGTHRLRGFGCVAGLAFERDEESTVNPRPTSPSSHLALVPLRPHPTQLSSHLAFERDEENTVTRLSRTAPHPESRIIRTDNR